MILKTVFSLAAVAVFVCIAGSSTGYAAGTKHGALKPADSLSFKDDVYPLIKQHCLPCHAEDNFNPSELSLDTYGDLMSGGKHGKPVVPGKSRESILIQKLSDKPPFGDRMPLNSKKKVEEGKAKWLSPEEIRKIAEWIDQGAKER